jgi:hypothetical protein
VTARVLALGEPGSTAAARLGTWWPLEGGLDEGKKDASSLAFRFSNSHSSVENKDTGTAFTNIVI